MTLIEDVTTVVDAYAATKVAVATEEMQRTIDKQNATISLSQQNLATVNARVGDLSTQLSNQATALSGKDQQIAALNTQLSTAQSALAAATADDASDNAKITALSSQVTALQAQLAGAVQASGGYSPPAANTVAPVSGKSPSLALGASTKNLVFPEGVFQWSDTAEAAGNAGGWFRSAGVFGQGIGKTILQLAANSGKTAIDKAARGSGVILKYLFRIDGATEFGGFSIIGTAQSVMKYFNGLNVYKGRRGYVHDLYVEGIPGYDSAPPGETPSINNNSSIGEHFQRIYLNLKGSSSGFASNHSSDTLLEDFELYDSTFGAGAAFYKETNATIRNGKVHGNAKPGLNFEQTTGLVTIENVEFSGNGVDIAINANQAYKSATFEIEEPKKSLGVPLSIRIGSAGYLDFESRDTAVKQSQSWADVWVTIDGVRKAAKDWGASVVTCLS
jgi:hypothetical protein